MTQDRASMIPAEPSSPPGRTRIMNSLGELLETKEFNRITTAEIARAAGVTEGLIYKYFKDKHDLLFQVLKVLFQEVVDDIGKQLSQTKSPSENLRTFIEVSVRSYARSRVFSKIILLEVRNTPKFYSSDAYSLVRKYSGMLKDVLRQGIDSGDFIDDIDIRALRELILGTIEHACLSSIIFEREINVERVVCQLCRILFHGISLPASLKREQVK